MLLAMSCVACGAADGPVCQSCAGDLTPAGEVTVAGLDRCWALFTYAGSGPLLVAALKYANRRGAVGPLARAAAGLVAEPVDLVTWVPAEPGHRRQRGFDQGELLALGGGPPAAPGLSAGAGADAGGGPDRPRA